MKKTVLLGLIMIISLPVFGQNETKEKQNYDEAIALVDVWLDAMQRFDELPGISAIALEDQEVIWEGRSINGYLTWANQ
jgi:hypothetical protein